MLDLTAANRPAPRTDISGFAVFAHGDLGTAHVLAHECLDAGRLALGRRVLGACLRGMTGSGSDWSHLQWHMAIFELGLGDWDAAHRRFNAHIVPAVAPGLAGTDAPQMLWRLGLADPSAKLDWTGVRDAARATSPASMYGQLHQLLALAGAGDLEGLDGVLRSHLNGSPFASLLAEFAAGLRAFVTHDHDRAAALLSRCVPQLGLLGGSRGQNTLFSQILAAAQARSALRRAA